MLKAVMHACLSFGTRYYTLANIVEATGMDRKEVRNRLGKLASYGFISRLNRREVRGEKGWPVEEITYRNSAALKKHVEGPRTSSNRKANGWDKMWMAARALRRFTRNDLATICEQSLTNVTFFTKTYRDRGYLRCLGGAGQRNVVWVLVKYPGPHRPIENAPDVKKPRERENKGNKTSFK